MSILKWFLFHYPCLKQEWIVFLMFTLGTWFDLLEVNLILWGFPMTGFPTEFLNLSCPHRASSNLVITAQGSLPWFLQQFLLTSPSSAKLLLSVGWVLLETAFCMCLHLKDSRKVTDFSVCSAFHLLLLR